MVSEKLTELSVQYSAALEHCPFVPGNLEMGGSSDGAGLPDNTCRFSVHRKLTGKEGAGVGDASGMFPIDGNGKL